MRPSSFRRVTRRWPRSWLAAMRVHRRDRSVSRDIRAWRDPFAQRTVRREGRWPAGVGDHWSATPDFDGSGYQQEVDLHMLFGDVSEFVQTCTVAGAGPTPCRQGSTYRLSRAEVLPPSLFPNDVQEPRPGDLAAERSRRGLLEHRLRAATACFPTASLADEAARLLIEGERVGYPRRSWLAECGQRIGSGRQLLGAGVAKALLGKSAVPDNLPFVTGSIGHPGYTSKLRADGELRHPPHRWFDLSLRRMAPSEGVPEESRSTVTPRGSACAIRWMCTSSGTPGRPERRCSPSARVAPAQSWRQWIEQASRIRGNEIPQRADEEAEPLNPERVALELNPHLPDRAILTADSGSSTIWWARNVRSAKACSPRSPAALRRWDVQSPTRSQPRWHIPIGP